MICIARGFPMIQKGSSPIFLVDSLCPWSTYLLIGPPVCFCLIVFSIQTFSPTDPPPTPPWCVAWWPPHPPAPTPARFAHPPGIAWWVPAGFRCCPHPAPAVVRSRWWGCCACTPRRPGGGDEFSSWEAADLLGKINKNLKEADLEAQRGRSNESVGLLVKELYTLCRAVPTLTHHSDIVSECFWHTIWKYIPFYWNPMKYWYHLVSTTGIFWNHGGSPVITMAIQMIE